MIEMLAIGCSYETKHGRETLIGVVPDRTVAKGICYEFQSENGDTRFVRPYEVDAFFNEGNDD